MVGKNLSHYKILFLCCIVAFGCAPATIQDPSQTEIPENAIEIRLQGDLDPDLLFDEVKDKLSSYRIQSSSEERRHIITQYEPIGKGLRLSIHVTIEFDTISSRPVCVFTGYAARPGGRINPARWTRNGGDGALAFAELLEIARTVPHKSLIYDVPR